MYYMKRGGVIEGFESFNDLVNVLNNLMPSEDEADGALMYNPWHSLLYYFKRGGGDMITIAEIYSDDRCLLWDEVQKIASACNIMIERDSIPIW